MIKITITSNHAKRLQGIGAASGKPYDMHIQKGYAHIVDPDTGNAVPDTTGGRRDSEGIRPACARRPGNIQVKVFDLTRPVAPDPKLCATTECIAALGLAAGAKVGAVAPAKEYVPAGSVVADAAPGPE